MTLPRSVAGQVDLEVFTRHLRFVESAGVKGFVLNGATGEYCLTSPEELGQILRSARGAVRPSTKLLAAVGGASLPQTMARVQAAQAADADALLLPMPYFFPYEQQDLIAFSRHVAERVNLPTLLYNLPDFTTPLEPETTLQLLAETKLAGIKDSSGRLDTVRRLTESGRTANRVIGNDAALYPALLEGLCDGVVSGIASVLPELMLALYSAAQESPLAASALELKSALDDVLQWVGRFPVPWGLKIMAAERGFLPADYALPLSDQRRQDARKFAAWFQAHRARLLATSSIDATVPTAAPIAPTESAKQ